MIVYLAGYRSFEKYYTDPTDDIWLLSSFFEHRGADLKDYLFQEKHILDSGAFSTFKNPKEAQKIDWDDYVERYIQLINKTNQKLFFEMDIDCVVGLEKVEYYRKIIEDKTGKQPIPVWHFHRGWDYFESMCESYPYVAIGTVPVTRQGQLIRKNPLILKKFIDTAHKHKTKIHGLGFTQTGMLDKLNFDSIDSTSWLSGGKYGQIYQFNGREMIYTNPPKGMRVANYKTANTYNFKEWIKFQKYAEQYL